MRPYMAEATAVSGSAGRPCLPRCRSSEIPRKVRTAPSVGGACPIPARQPTGGHAPRRGEHQCASGALDVLEHRSAPGVYLEAQARGSGLLIAKAATIMSRYEKLTDEPMMTCATGSPRPRNLHHIVRRAGRAISAPAPSLSRHARRTPRFVGLEREPSGGLPCAS